MIHKEKRLGNERISKLLLEFAVPAIIGMMVVALYSVIDRIFVGQFVGPLAMAGVSMTFPVAMFMMACGMLIGIGSGASISIKLGQQKRDEAEEILGNAFSLLLIIAFMMTLIGYVFILPRLSSLGADPTVIVYSRQFIQIIITFSLFQFIGFGLNGSINASGHPKIGMTTMLMNACINIVLLIFFVGIFHWGVRGSAFSTVIAQFISAVWVLRFLTSSKASIRLKARNLRLRWSRVKLILAIGMGPFTLQMGSSLVIFVLNLQLLKYGGDLAVGAMGAIFALGMLLMMPIIGISQGAQPIIGYNYGAKNIDRVKKTFKLAVSVASIHAVVAFILIQAFPHVFIQMFSQDRELVRIGTQGIRLWMGMIPFLGYLILGANFFLAIGKAPQSMLLNLSRQFIFLVPLLYILPSFWGLNGIWISGPLSDFAAIFVTTGMLVWQFRALKHIPLPDLPDEKIVDAEVQEMYCAGEASEQAL